jgi:hypothetical protein
MTYDDSPFGWIQEARDLAQDVGQRRSDDDDLPPLCSAIICLADALKAILAKEQTR